MGRRSDDTFFDDVWAQMFGLLAIVSGVFSAHYLWLSRGAGAGAWQAPFGACSPRSPGHWAVGDGGCASVGAALERARDGDEILLSPGTYRESLKILKSVTIAGVSGGSERTVIENAGRLTLSAAAGNVALRDLTVSNMGSRQDWAIYVAGARLRLHEVRVRAEGGGVHVYNGDLDAAQTSVDARIGISVEERSNAVLAGVRVRGSEVGVQVSGEGSELALSQSDVSESREAGLQASRFARVRIKGSWLTGNSVAIVARSGADLTLESTRLAKSEDCAIRADAAFLRLSSTEVRGGRCGVEFIGSGTLKAEDTRFAELSQDAVHLPPAARGQVSVTGARNVGLRIRPDGGI